MDLARRLRNNLLGGGRGNRRDGESAEEPKEQAAAKFYSVERPTGGPIQRACGEAKRRRPVKLECLDASPQSAATAHSSSSVPAEDGPRFMSVDQFFHLAYFGILSFFSPMS